MTRLFIYFCFGVFYLLLTMLSSKSHVNFYIPFLLIMMNRLPFIKLLVCFALLSMLFAGASMTGFGEIFLGTLLLAVCHQYMRWDVGVIRYYFNRALLWVLICETIFYIKWHGVLQISVLDRVLHAGVGIGIIMFWVFPLEYLHQIFEAMIQKLLKKIFPKTEFSWINLRTINDSSSRRNPFSFKIRRHY